jgi:acetyl esterase/lipase
MGICIPPGSIFLSSQVRIGATQDYGHLRTTCTTGRYVARRQKIVDVYIHLLTVIMAARYGPRPRNTMDIYIPPGTLAGTDGSQQAAVPVPVAVFTHGGVWVGGGPPCIAGPVGVHERSSLVSSEQV